MARLVEATPEPLTSNMRVSTAMILDVVDRPGDPFTAMRRLLTENPPWWYLPVWGFASTPLLILLLAVTGMAVLAWRLLVAGRAGTGSVGTLLARPDVSLILRMSPLDL